MSTTLGVIECDLLAVAYSVNNYSRNQMILFVLAKRARTVTRQGEMSLMPAGKKPTGRLFAIHDSRACPEKSGVKDEQPDRFLIFDRDAKFSAGVVSSVKQHGAEPGALFAMIP
jgi:hypothetical protein